MLQETLVISDEHTRLASTFIFKLLMPFAPGSPRHPFINLPLYTLDLPAASPYSAPHSTFLPFSVFHHPLYCSLKSPYSSSGTDPYSNKPESASRRPPSYTLHQKHRYRFFPCLHCPNIDYVSSCQT